MRRPRRTRCGSCGGMRSQAAFSSETRRAVQVVTGVEGHGLKPWREVITPHRDVRDGNMRGAEFAADLYWVSRGEGSREYVEPVEFFRRTYLTDGLRELLDGGGAADRRGPERVAGVEPADELRRRQDALDARAVAPAVRHAAGRVPGRGAKLLPVTSRCRPRGGSCWSATTSRRARQRRSPTGRRCIRCGESLPGSSGSRPAARRRRGGRTRSCVPPTRPGPTRPTRSAR